MNNYALLKNGKIMKILGTSGEFYQLVEIDNSGEVQSINESNIVQTDTNLSVLKNKVKK